MFVVNIGWQTIRFKFDGLWTGFEEIADKVMNQLGVGGLIVEKQKRYLHKQTDKLKMNIADFKVGNNSDLGILFKNCRMFI